jgi:hypothetical protein
MTRNQDPEMSQILDGRIRAWLADAGSSVEYAEQVEGRWAVRMRQETRDATTVWFEVGERSLQWEAYLMPAGDGASALFAQALSRNMRAWRCFYALDHEGGLVLRGRLSRESVTHLELDLALGEIYETIEVSFRPMLRALLRDRENSG